MFVLSLLAIITFSDGANLLNKDNSYNVEPCNEKGIVENECIRCECSINGKLQCSLKNVGDCKEDLNPSCLPNIMYELNNTVCICNGSGKWPNAQCNKVFRTLDRTLEVNCKPNSYFNSDCNVCKCGSDGKIDKARCTRNKCTPNKHINSRRISNNVYGKCEVGNWYSLAPCQFCFCVNQNKLVCNTGHAYAQKLELGAYNLSVCGKELIREAVELIPENQKALRINTKAITKPPATSNQITLEQSNFEVNVNREESNLNKNKNANDQEEYYTDSEETKQPELKGREDLSIPIQVNNKSPKKEYEDLETEESEDEIEKSSPFRKVVKEFEINLQEAHKQPQTVDQLPDGFNLGEALKLNLPMVLDKVFQMALKKSMVTVNAETKCTPGAATILKCNVCFCMKENKLLCTNNECK